MIKKEKVDDLETLTAQLGSIHTELTALSRKSPNDGVNKFKLKFINTVIERCNTFLGDPYRPFKEFATFDEEEVVSNSDATFMVSLYLEAMEKFRSDHIKEEEDGFWYYDVSKGEGLRTSSPRRLRRNDG